MFESFKTPAGSWRLPTFVACIALAGCGIAESARVVPDRAPDIKKKAEKQTMTAIEIEGPNQRWTARILGTAAGRDFLAQLPLTLTLKDYADTEKVAGLPRPLTREGAPTSITPRTGDLTSYAPWGNLAIFYKNGRRSPGLIPLGRIDGDVASLATHSSLAVTIRRAAR